MRLWYCLIAHASNTWIIQEFKLLNKIKLSNKATSNSNDDLLLSDSDANDKKENESNVNKNVNIATPLNIILKNIEDLYDTNIESKYTKI